MLRPEALAGSKFSVVSSSRTARTWIESSQGPRIQNMSSKRKHNLIFLLDSISLQTCIHFKAEQKASSAKRRDFSSAWNDAACRSLNQSESRACTRPRREQEEDTIPARSFSRHAPRSLVISPCSRPVYLTACIVPSQFLTLIAGVADGASALSSSVRGD